jgi:hypothetical protein
MITHRDALVAILWIVVLAVNLATTGEVTIFGDDTDGPAAAIDRLLGGLAVQGPVR